MFLVLTITLCLIKAPSCGRIRLEAVIEMLRTIGKTQSVAVIGQHKLGTKKAVTQR
jgi:hypothetical protein